MNLINDFIKVRDCYISSNYEIKSIKDAEELHNILIALRVELYTKGIIEVMPHYRGEQNYDWDITPGIFRPPLDKISSKEGKVLEQKVIIEFEKEIIKNFGENVLRNLFNQSDYGKQWDLLFQAQHAGIKTSLTDWSARYDSALFFSTEFSKIDKIEDAHGQIWCFLFPNELIKGHSNFNEKSIFAENPFEIKETIIINSSFFMDNIESRLFEHRMLKQYGRFLMCSSETCNIPINKQEKWSEFILKIKIPKKFKSSIREELVTHKITRKELYVDENHKLNNLIESINDKYIQYLNC